MLAARWLLPLVLLAGGCSSSDADLVVGDSSPFDSSAVADSTILDAGSDSATDSDAILPDTGTVVTDIFVDRALTILFGAPDLTPKFVCFGVFGPTSVPAALDAPVSFQPSAGALGVPSAAAPTDPTETTAFPYGAVVRVPLNADFIAALKVFKVVIYLLDANPAKIGSTCGAEWKNVKADPKNWKAVDPKYVNAGQHVLLSMIGCLGAPDATGTCGTAGNNFEFRLDRVDLAKPATGNIGFQFLHLSQFPGSTASGAPSWSPVDVYLMPMPAPSSGTPPTPTFLKIADNVSYRSIAAASKGIDLPSWASGEDSYLVVAPRVGSGASVACSNADGRPSAVCPNYTLALKPFLDIATGPYPRVGGGLVPGTNQVIGLIGSGVAPVVDGGVGSPSLRIPFIKASPAPGKAW